MRIYLNKCNCDRIKKKIHVSTRKILQNLKYFSFFIKQNVPRTGRIRIARSIRTDSSWLPAILKQYRIRWKSKNSIFSSVKTENNGNFLGIWIFSCSFQQVKTIHYRMYVGDSTNYDEMPCYFSLTIGLLIWMIFNLLYGHEFKHKIKKLSRDWEIMQKFLSLIQIWMRRQNLKVHLCILLNNAGEFPIDWYWIIFI